MLESNVLHQSRSGPRGDGDVVGISWKAPTRSHPSPSLVVTCAHQVVVYKPGEERRTHQWSFKPSAATVLSHAAVFLPAASRYVGVQQGSNLVSWRESEQDVKRPLSSQAAGAVHAVHACPQLGDHFVVVLATGAVSFYQGGLQRVAHCDTAAGGGNDGARPKAVWSGVRGNKVIVLENLGAASDRITTFTLTVGDGAAGLQTSSSRRTNASGGGGSAAAVGAAPASVALVSSHVLTKPSLAALGDGEDDEEEAVVVSACSATFLGRESVGGGGGGRSVISVAWRTSRGPMWTRVLLGADGATEEFSRPAGMVRNHHTASAELNGNGTIVSASSPSNGHGSTSKSSKSRAKNLASGRVVVVSGGKGRASAGWSRVPAIAAADGGRLLLHSGGEMNARLAVWDAAYGVLLEDEAAPEGSSEGGGGGRGASSSSCGRDGRAVGMKVSGDGAHLALAVAGRVLVCPIPVKAAGTLASLLRRKRPSSSEAGSLLVAGGSSSRPPFPSVDLARSAPAWKLLEKTGAPEAGQWEATVVTPFREAEAKVVRSLEDAACRKDGEAFERVLLEHLGQQQQRAALVGGGESAGGKVCSDGRKKRPRGGGGGRDGGDCSAGIVAAAVELCLANPDAKLWGALAVLVRSGGVSARHHRGLVVAIVDHASPDLLEEVMLHVPDLPEADAVRILRHFVSQAAALAEGSKNPNTAAAVASASAPAVMPVPEVPNKASGGARPAKRARGGNGGGAVSVSAGDALPSADVAQGDAGGGGVVVSVLSPSKKSGAGPKRAAVGSDGGDKKAAVAATTTKKKKKSEAGQTTTISMDDDVDGGDHRHTNGIDNGSGNGNAMMITSTNTSTSLSNGHSAAHDDGGTSSDGGFSDGGTQTALSTGANGTPAAAAATAAGVVVAKIKQSTTEPGEAAHATTAAAAAARAERGLRVALTLSHNDAFLRSALAGLSHGEVVVVLKVLTRLLAEGKTLETGAARLRGKNAIAARGLPPTRLDSVVGWACAVLDSHFTRLAIGGSANENLVGALQALKKATRGEAECCELLCQVRSLVDEVGRRQAAAAAAAADDRRRSSRELFTLRVLTF